MKPKEPKHKGFWAQVDDATVHIQADPNMSEETAAALAEMVCCAIRAIKNGTLGTTKNKTRKNTQP